jgi:hypothetical protein
MKTKHLIAILTVLIVAAVAIWWPGGGDKSSAQTGDSGQRTATSGNTSAGQRTAGGSVAGKDGEPHAEAGKQIIDTELDAPADLMAEIEQIAAAFTKGGLSGEESSVLLARLAKALKAAPAEAATAAILSYLRSGRDADTGLNFQPGPGGALAQAPTMRTALLDLLAQIDPAAAMQLARSIMDTTKSADEYALALRNLAWNNTDGRLSPELSNRLAQMLGRDEWLRNPSAGFLEGFDVAVHLGGQSQFQEMARLLERASAQASPNVPSANGSIERAAFIALDRMAVTDPGTTTDTFTKNPDLFSQSGDHRASLLSRADILDPNQRAAVENYLLRNDLGEKELAAFAGLFPNVNRFAGNRLVTGGDQQPSLDALKARDTAMREIVLQWKNDPRFARRATTISTILDRLDELLH